MSVQYKKHFSCTSDIVSLLLDRGLIIEDVDFAQRYIDRVGYYRLSGYLYPMLRFPKENHSLYKSYGLSKKNWRVNRFGCEIKNV